MPSRAAAPKPPDFSEFTTDDALAEAMEGDTALPEPTISVVPTYPDAADVPQEPAHEEHDVHFVADTAALQASHGEPRVWAGELGRLIGAITGRFIDEESLEDWLATYQRQVQQQTFRSALFQVANTQLPMFADGDAALQLVQLRNDIALGMRRQAGMA